MFARSRKNSYRWSIPAAGFIVTLCCLALTDAENVKCEKAPKATEPAAALAKTGIIEPDDKGPGPRITFEERFHHFGKVDTNTKYTCDFEFTNTGNSILRIEEVTLSCGCLKGTATDKEEYLPGEAGTVHVKFRSGDSGLTVKKHVYITSNDKNNPKTDLIIKADQTLKVDHDPERLYLSLVEENAGCPQITLHSRDNQPFAIKDFKSTGDCITADYDSSIERTKFILDAKVDTKNLENNLIGHINISVTHPECDSVIIHYETLPRFEVSPSSIVIFDAEPQKPVIKEVWVFSNYARDFKVLDVRMEKCCIVKLLSQEKIDNRYKLRLEITPPAVKDKEKYFTDTTFVPMRGDGFRIINIKCRGFYLKSQQEISRQ
jgi:hypothetical protein